MSLAPGTRIGPYEVVSLLGAGGMGEVYQAADSNLKRLVALKVLPDALASDAEHLARFQREAEVLASLNHPNIAAVHGLERTGPTTALVMELVEGPTLADRLGQGPLPVNDALAIAKQIAEALEAAHQKAIIHRDLKPANIKVREDGTVKVLDFGLAKALEAAPHPHDTSRSPTITSPALTRLGVILGTAAYMSPEQAKGRAADKRSDMWAFGCVLYEMLTGTRAFRGDDVSDTLAAVLRDEPDWTALPQETPAPIRRLLRHCLAKDSKARIGDASTARIEITDAQSEPETARQLVPDRERRRGYLAWAAACAVVAFIAGGATGWRLKPASVPSRPLARFPIPLPTGQRFTNPGHSPVAFSADGTVMVYTANFQLHARPLAQLEPVPIRGTEGGRSPFFSRWPVDWLLGGRAVEESLDDRRRASAALLGGKPLGRELGGGHHSLWSRFRRHLARVCQRRTARERDQGGRRPGRVSTAAAARWARHPLYALETRRPRDGSNRGSVARHRRRPRRGGGRH
jgi:serine/threonine-protein kinase